MSVTLNADNAALTRPAGQINRAITYDEWSVTSGSVDLFGYTGREIAIPSGTTLWNYRARHYNATWGRFLSEDPLPLPFRADLDGYSYGRNSPIDRIDPFGLKDCGPFPKPTGLCAGDAISRYYWGLCNLNGPLTLASNIDTFVVTGLLGALVGVATTKDPKGAIAGAIIGTTIGVVWSSFKSMNEFKAASAALHKQYLHELDNCKGNNLDACKVISPGFGAGGAQGGAPSPPLGFWKSPGGPL